MKVWPCGAPPTAIPSALRPKGKEMFDLDSENFHDNNANKRFLLPNRAVSHCISLIQKRCLEIGWYRRQQKPEMRLSIDRC